ncbi:hypothetical protein BABINDRAFT_172173 [Babjeviella inositovora NRRL Y-12698]|uniref:Peptidase S54 rhomboid domain-containing protein n=1 Tax=Babjeviella inositovora NRRL Y-12698 TaxID=984486 RepID=A0A1E3QMQ4_9ASCO|nr:uncharacterized protein BABINDRAFT_172173 [Babjeviella inositovora NRRL Y-12698]ODQ78920.1 hypothetical protein BABINDRAFT_172173 [Babjeviella inositovora NRRL Y-12698]
MTRISPIKAFINTPISQLCCVVTLAVPFATSLMDIKYLFLLSYTPAIAQWHQYWRFATFQTAFTQESDVLLGVLLWYNFKVLERLYGSHKYLTVIFLAFVWNAVLVAALFFLNQILVQFTGWSWFNTVASGPLAILFSLLAIYYSKVPVSYLFEVQLTPQDNPSHVPKKLLLSDKSFVYVLTLQMFVNNGWHSMVPCLVGLVTGCAIVNDFLPGQNRWRIPLRAVSVPEALTEPEEEEEEDAAEPVRPLTTQLLNTFRA